MKSKSLLSEEFFAARHQIQTRKVKTKMSKRFGWAFSEIKHPLNNNQASRLNENKAQRVKQASSK